MWSCLAGDHCTLRFTNESHDGYGKEESIWKGPGLIPTQNGAIVADILDGFVGEVDELVQPDCHYLIILGLRIVEGLVVDVPNTFGLELYG